MIKNSLVYLGLLLLICLKVNGSFQKGCLILVNGDSINCSIEVRDYYVFIYSDKITYLDQTIKKIKATEVAQVLVDTLVYDKFSGNLKMYVQEGPRMVYKDYKDIFFAALIVNGYFKLYKRYEWKYNSQNDYVGHLIWSFDIKTDKGFFSIQKFTFQEDLNRIFKDYPSILERITSMDFKFDDIEELVKVANITYQEIK